MIPLGFLACRLGRFASASHRDALTPERGAVTAKPWLRGSDRTAEKLSFMRVFSELNLSTT